MNTLSMVLLPAITVAGMAMLPISYPSLGRSAQVGGSAATTGYSSMYDDSLLEQTRRQNAEIILQNVNEVFLPKLTPAELQPLRGLIFNFPLRHPNDPLAFYMKEGQIFMSAASIRFFRDVSIAAVWLTENSYSLES